METRGRTELLDNIEFLPGPIEIVHPKNYEIIQLILKLMRPNSYNKEYVEELLRPIWIEPEKKCWFRSKDWSHHSNIRGMQAHRMSFEIFIGPLIVGYEICHHCDRPGCINPWHLFQGTHSDNMKDAMNKGRIFNINIRRK